jgi:hypothetical protein
MKLILIHGRDQQGKDPDVLKTTWINTWEEGLKKNGLIIPEDLEMIFPYYGDLLDSLVKEANLPTTINKVIARGDSSATPDMDFFNDFLLEVAANSNISEAKITENFDGQIQERGPLNWEWIQAILKTLDKTPLGSLSIKKFTYDAYLYLTIPGIQNQINKFVSGLIDNKPSVVLGHSLGSAVGYNVLQSNPGFSVKKYITVGSPLGLNSFKSKLAEPLSMPACVSGGWYNAYDERDVVALQPLDKKYFNIIPPIKNYDGVNNHTKNRHGIEGYLDDAVVAKAIFDSLRL